MNYIPIVFCFDDNILMPAGICISSLLENAKSDTFYDIFILHDNFAKYPYSGFLERLYDKYKNFRINYRNIGNQFDNAFEIRGITKATYYRLLIPNVISEYDKIMYHDVDVIFRDDLSQIFHSTEMEGFYYAGVSSPYSEISSYVNQHIGVPIEKYIATGNLIINSKLIRKDNIVSQLLDCAKKKWKYQDMDVINFTCKNYIKILAPYFCVVGTTSEILKNINQPFYSKEEAEMARTIGIIHYNGSKPWNGWCYNFDIWWEYYRKSIYYDPEFYFNFYQNKLLEYDQLGLVKRLKIFVRYFTHKKEKIQ